MSDFAVILTTVPSEEVGLRVARTLVEERLCACANLVPGVRSIYTWQGKVEDDREILVVLKTRRDLFEKVDARIRALHPYEVPEVVMLPVEAGSERYLAWVGEVTGP